MRSNPGALPVTCAAAITTVGVSAAMCRLVHRLSHVAAAASARQYARVTPARAARAPPAARAHARRGTSGSARAGHGSGVRLGSHMFGFYSNIKIVEKKCMNAKCISLNADR